MKVWGSWIDARDETFSVKIQYAYVFKLGKKKTKNKTQHSLVSHQSFEPRRACIIHIAAIM